jgi:hypothetical protein
MFIELMEPMHIIDSVKSITNKPVNTQKDLIQIKMIFYKKGVIKWAA